MDESNQNSQTPTPVNNSNNQEDKNKNAIIYFLGIIIVSVLVVGYIIFKIIGLL